VTPSAALARQVLRACGLALVLLGLVAVRVVVSARAELGRAEALLAQRDREGAIVHLRRAARWYAPLSPYHVRALAELQRIAREAEQQHEPELALSAYRAVRGAILATRSVYVPERARLEAANQSIAQLMAEQPAPGMDAGKSRETLRQEHLALLMPIPGPNVFWSCVVLAGFACWVVSAFAFSVHAIDDEDRWVQREVRRWGSLVALGFGLFVLGMALV
jgi:hypothetical protein